MDFAKIVRFDHIHQVGALRIVLVLLSFVRKLFDGGLGTFQFSGVRFVSRIVLAKAFSKSVLYCKVRVF